MIVARAPLRLSFGGGGTDLPAYYERYGGLVLSSSIEAACHVSIETHPGSNTIVRSLDYGRAVTIPGDRPLSLDEPLSLPRAALAWFATHWRRPTGLWITTWADVAPGSGLGSSSAMAVALVAALARQTGLPLTRREMAEIACEIEIDILGRPIGRQDQYASAVGGFNLLMFRRDGVDVLPSGIAPQVTRSLEAHLLVMSTRRTRDSATLLRGQRDACAADGDVTDRLHRIKQLALAMRDALAASDLPRFGALLDQSWQLKRGLSQDVTSPALDRWYQTARSHGAYGGKIAGAGGGGHFIFCVPPAQRAQVIAALEQEGLRIRPIALEVNGCVISRDSAIEPPFPGRNVKGSAHEPARSLAS